MAIDAIDSDRPRPARADHRRPFHRQDDHLRGHDDQSGAQSTRPPKRPANKNFPSDLQHLRRDWPEAVENIARVVGVLEEAGALPYTIISRLGVRLGLEPISRAVRRCGHRRMVHGQRHGRADHLRRFVPSTRWRIARCRSFLKRPSGREAYPGDVFYLHSACSNAARASAKNTATARSRRCPLSRRRRATFRLTFRRTLISITDGQIYLETDLFYQGVRPAISVGLSVSRVGSASAGQGDEAGRRSRQR